MLLAGEPPAEQSAQVPSKAEAQQSKERQPAKADRGAKAATVKPSLTPPEKFEAPAAPGTPAAKPGLESVGEMKVESTSRGISRKGDTDRKSDSGIHGEIRGSDGPVGRATAGTVVLHDRKDGKVAVTVSGDSVKGKR